jgi:hypothetical protein
VLVTASGFLPPSHAPLQHLPLSTHTAPLHPLPYLPLTPSGTHLMHLGLSQVHDPVLTQSCHDFLNLRVILS